MNEILFDVLLFTVILCSTLITSVVVPYLKEKIEDFKYKALLDEIDNAIRKTEQKVIGEGQGPAKKARVIAYITSWLADRKIIITDEQLDTLIEAAVYRMNNE